jgi:hypothetical protein
MTGSGWAAIAAVVESVVKTAAIVFAGGWAFWRYVYQGEFKRRVQFDVDVTFVAEQDDIWHVELVALVDNKGLVTHRIADFGFKLRSIYPEDPIEEAGQRVNFQTNFPHKLKEGTWLPSRRGNTFVRPGICTRYTYVTTVPGRAIAVVLTGRFRYPEKDSYHTAVKLLKVPSAGPPVAARATEPSN